MAAGNRRHAPFVRSCSLFLRVPISLLVLIVSSSWCLAQEHILDLDAALIIEADSSVTVTETIAVQYGANPIMRRFTRVFPPFQNADEILRVGPDIEIIEVLMDGFPATSSLEDTAQGYRLHIGDENGHLVPGDYVFTITYRLFNQITFKNDLNSLVWTVVGHDWRRRIDQTTARVVLPDGAEAIEAAVFTGPDDGTLHREDLPAGQNEIVVTNTRGIGARDALILIAAWPEGFVTGPGISERMP